MTIELMVWLIIHRTGLEKVLKTKRLKRRNIAKRHVRGLEDHRGTENGRQQDRQDTHYEGGEMNEDCNEEELEREREIE